MADWILTDPDCLQMRKQMDEECVGIFELLQVDEYGGQMDNSKPYYVLASGEIDLNEFTKEEISQVLDVYGYESIEHLKGLVGSEVEAFGQIAEMLFEVNSTEYYVMKFDTWNSALEEIERRTGADLSMMREAEKPALSDIIKASEAKAVSSAATLNSLAKEQQNHGR